MHAHDFHATPIGHKVRARIGNADHIAKIRDKNVGKRKFHLKFHLVTGDKRVEWRSALRCESVVDQSTPMGVIRPLTRNL